MITRASSFLSHVFRPLLWALLGGAGLVATNQALAALNEGDKAPDFSVEATVGGEALHFHLAEALKSGPVVLYFYPKAFTKGCTIEAHEFAEATPKFKALGATVIGISTDDIATLKKFSVEACRSQFAVAADTDGQVTKAFDAGIPMMSMSSRISYLITPDAHIAAVYKSMSPEGHVDTMMKAAAQLKAAGH
ncbi:MAG: peroxiredoxin [Burkholderiaceae bacterium]|nr:peroxiredoxin [Roseateles sp.]MBV8470440.1 peroxiredoxin [Burkholderiaceae bacterium]